MPWYVWFMVGFIAGTVIDLLLLGFMDLVKYSDRELRK